MPLIPTLNPILIPLTVLILTLLIGGLLIDCVDNMLKSTVTYYSSIYTYTCNPCSGAYTRIVESSVAYSVEG